MSAEPIGQRDSYFQISLVGKMQSSNIDISDPPQLGEDDNIKVLASSALSTEQSAEVKAIQEEQFGFSEVFRQHGQNGILWIDGHSAEFEIFLDEQQRITIVDIHGTKLHPENVTVLKFKDQEISAGEIGEASKDQIEFEWTNFSNLTISEISEPDDQVFTEDDALFVSDNNELSLQTHTGWIVNTNVTDQKPLIADDVFTILEDDSTENSLFDQLTSGTDLFGADLAAMPIDHDSLWHSPLSENIFFDTALVYSSHEFISLEGGKKLYDDSPSDSLIFVNEGVSDLIISEKKADIFLEADSSTSITGANSKINLFQTIDSESEVKLSGDFSKLSLNLYQGNDTKIPEARIVDNRLFIDESGSKSIDLSEIQYGSSVIEFNIYNNDGLVDSKTIQYNPSLKDAFDIAPAASPDVVGENVEEILFGEPKPDFLASELLFEDDVEIVRLDHDGPNQESVSENVQNTIGKPVEPHFSIEIAQHVEELITEPTKLLEMGQLFADPLDVFDDSDFT